MAGPSRATDAWKLDAYGYHFIETPTGAMNGNFVGIGADYACNASVQVSPGDS